MTSDENFQIPITERTDKHCPKCKEVKPIQAFSRNRANQDGYESYCKPCKNELRKEQYHKHGKKQEQEDYIESKQGKVIFPIEKNEVDLGEGGEMLQKVKNARYSHDMNKKITKKMDEASLNQILTEVLPMKRVENNPIAPDTTNNDIKLEPNEQIINDVSQRIISQYDEDLKKSNEIYDLFYNSIASGNDKSQGAKEGLTKSVELRISASTNLTKLMEIAAKMVEKQNNAKNNNNNGKSFNININNIKNSFDKK